MSRLWVPVALLSGVGVTLILSEFRWFARRPIDERLQPYVPGGWQRPVRHGVLSVGTFREVIRPLAGAVGDLIGQLFGLRDDLSTRLERVHSPIDAGALRVRQFGRAVAVMLAGATLVTAVGAPFTLSILVVIGGPLLTFLVIEQQVISASNRWQRRVFLELPVVSEQIGMLLSAGFSLGMALERVSQRSNGACARDLQRVGRRVRQGLSESEALREWADLVDVPAVHRLVGVLSLNRDTGDLGRLISEEARSVRREVHRQLIVQIHRRAQQVWIPVTVSTLLPGTLLLAVPFLQAMRLFGA